MIENIIFYIVGIIWIAFHCWCLLHYGNKLKLQNLEKRDLYNKEKGFKLYEWKSKIKISLANYGWIYDYESGKGYFRNEEELKNWLQAEDKQLTFCREL